MRLPPPDPNEPADSEPDQATVLSPTVVFAAPPSQDAERIAAAILHSRPGMLFIHAES